MVMLQHSGWQVTTIDPNAYTTNAAGDAVYGARIGFVTNAGNGGRVFLPDNLLTPGNVAAEISKRAAIMDTVGSLTQPPEGVEV